MKYYLSVFLIFFMFSGCEKKSTDGNGDGDKTGCDVYEEQFASIHDEIDGASDGDTIFIDPGTYTGSINFNGKDIVVGSLFLTTGDTSYIRQTVIDANNFGSVVRFENNESPAAALVGLTLTNGHAVEGGGVYINGASPTLSNLRIENCEAYSCGAGNDFKGALGGGMYIKGSDAILEAITITQNSSEIDGGGIYMTNSDPSLTLVTIYQNSTIGFGGGIFCTASNPELLHVDVSNNETADKGGGFYATNFSTVAIENSTIGSNDAGKEGGGFYLSNSTLDLLNVYVGGNDAVEYGGSIFATGSIIESMNNAIDEGIYFPGTGGSSTMATSFTAVGGGLTEIETNGNAEVEWGEGSFDDSCAPDGGLFCVEGADFNVSGFSEGSPCLDKGDPDPRYYDVAGRYCVEIAVSATALPDSNTIRNDLGAYGGPNGRWLRNPRN